MSHKLQKSTSSHNISNNVKCEDGCEDNKSLVVEKTHSQSIVPISTKSKFVENIKKWVLIDTQIKHINEKTKNIREMKSQVIQEINQYVEENRLENTKIEISDGELCFFEKKDYTPLTYTYVEDCLANIIPDKKHIEYIMRYLKENRTIKISRDIRRKYNNTSST